MKSHLALKCSEVPHNIKIEYLHMIKNDKISSQQSTQTQQSKDNNNDKIDDLKIENANKALVRFFVCCGIPFSVVDSPFFIDFTKSLCYGYELPKRTTLSNRHLNAEIATITLKIEEELRNSTNLTLG